MPVDDADDNKVSVAGNGKSDKKLYGQHRGSWSHRDAEQRGTKKVVNPKCSLLYLHCETLRMFT